MKDLSRQIRPAQATSEGFTVPYASKWALRIATSAVVALSLSVNFGVALVSLSTLLILVACATVLFFGQITKQNSNDLARSNLTLWVVFLSIAWFTLSAFWSIAEVHQIWIEWIRYARLLIIPLVFFLIRTPSQGLRVIQFWVIGHMFVIMNSYLLWIGVPLPWATSDSPFQTLTPFTSSLEQPIMSSIIVAVLWFFRHDLSKDWGRGMVYTLLLMTMVNVFFLMIGRSGMLSMILVITMICGWALRPKFRILIILLPFVLFGILYGTSSRFEERVNAVPKEVAEYQKGKIDTSQAFRLEFWHRSIQAIQERPLIGSGIGSWPAAYKLALNGELGVPADSPHEQFFLWWVEGGTVGLLFLLTIFVAIYLDAITLQVQAKQALITILTVLLFTSLMNCPLQGAGMSEFFTFIMATLMAFPESLNSDKIDFTKVR